MIVFKRITSILTTVVVVVAVIVALLLVGVRIIGIEPYAVLSGSMEPEYPVGSLIYVKEVDPFELREGDDITYMLNEDTLSTHRIIEVVPDPEDKSVVRFRMQGIANDHADAQLVHCDNVVGQPQFHIPYLGYVSDYIQNPPGLYVVIAGGILVLLLGFLPDLFSDDKEKDKKKKKDEEETEAPAKDELPSTSADASVEPTLPAEDSAPETPAE